MTSVCRALVSQHTVVYNKSTPCPTTRPATNSQLLVMSRRLVVQPNESTTNQSSGVGAYILWSCRLRTAWVPVRLLRSTHEHSIVVDCTQQLSPTTDLSRVKPSTNSTALIVAGRLKMQGWKMREWKHRQGSAGVENFPPLQNRTDVSTPALFQRPHCSKSNKCCGPAFLS